MSAFLENWKRDLSSGWNGVVDGVEFDFNAIDADLRLGNDEPI